MFQFPRFPPPCLWVQQGVTGYCPAGFPHSEILGSTLAAAPRGLSQLATSFIGAWRQGIHREPLVA